MAPPPRDPFKPPPDKGPSLELDRPVPSAKTTAENVARVAQIENWQTPRRSPIPRLLATLAIVALVGGGAFVGWNRYSEQIGAWLAGLWSSGEEKPVVYTPLSQDDAVLITIDVSPRDARLLLDGDPLPSNPVRLKRGHTTHTLAATADGHAPLVQQFTPDAVKTLRLRMKRK